MLIGWIERHSWHWAGFPVVAAMHIDVSIVQASILLFGHICSLLDFRLKNWSKIVCLSIIQAFVEFAFSTLCWGHFWQQNSAIYSLMHCINYGSIPRCDELWLLAVKSFTYICSVKIYVLVLRSCSYSLVILGTYVEMSDCVGSLCLLYPSLTGSCSASCNFVLWSTACHIKV